MRNLLQCAITVAVLVSGAASNPVTIHTQTTWRAYVADLSNDIPVADQWTSATSQSIFTWQWDFMPGKISYSEEWRTAKSLLYSKDATGG